MMGTKDLPSEDEDKETAITPAQGSKKSLDTHLNQLKKRTEELMG